MGLDMYLYSRKNTAKARKAIKDLDSILDTEAGEYVKVKKETINELLKYCRNTDDYDEYEIAYWRKAYHIRKWFVDNLSDFQDEGNTVLTKEHVEDLLDTCNKVLKNHELAEELLPVPENRYTTKEETYDEWYFQQTEYTAEKLQMILDIMDWETGEVYYSEWY